MINKLEKKNQIKGKRKPGVIVCLLCRESKLSSASGFSFTPFLFSEGDLTLRRA